MIFHYKFLIWVGKKNYFRLETSPSSGHVTMTWDHVLQNIISKTEKKINTLRYMTEYRNPSSILKLFSEK